MKTQFVKLKSITKTKVDYVYDFTVENVHRIIAKHPNSKNAFYTSNCWHPDIMKFIKAKRADNKYTKFNLSVGVTEGFMDAVINDTTWDLKFPDTSFEKYDKEWDGDIEKWESKGYPVKVYKTIKARELWNEIMLNTYNFAEPGVLFLDVINKNNPLYYCENISSTNPCVIEGTYVDTPNGPTKVEDIKIGDFINTVHPRGYEPVKEIEKHDNVPVFKVTFSDGGEQIVTAAHRYHVVKKGSKIEKLRLDEINIGDHVRIHVNNNIDFEFDKDEYNKGVLCGIIIGDGCYTKNVTETHNIIKIACNIDEQDYIENIKKLITELELEYRKDDIAKDGSKSMSIILKNGIDILNEYGLDFAYSYDKTIPESFYKKSKSFLQGLINGILASDGNVSLKGDYPLIRIDTTSKTLAIQLKRILLMFGIHSRITSNSSKGGVINGRQIERKHTKYTLNIYSHNIRNMCKICYDNIHPKKREIIRTLNNEYKVPSGANKVRIVNIEPHGTGTVYDLYCEETDTWVTDGYVQQGCGEQTLPFGGACCLGSMMLHRFIKFDNNRNPYFDFESFGKYVELAIRFLDNVLDVSKYPLEVYKEEAHKKRRVGLGFMGLGTVCAMLGIEYGDNKEFNEFFEKLMYIKTYHEYKASALLGKEKGSFPVFDKDKYFDSYYWKQLPLSNVHKKEIESIGYLRNGVLSTVAPTGNTSLLAGIVSGGIEPIFLTEYVRWVTVTPDEIRRFKEQGYDIPDVKNEGLRETDIFKKSKMGNLDILIGTIDDVDYQIDESRGLVKAELVEDYSVRWLKENNLYDKYKNKTKTTSDLTVDDHLNVLKIAAKYIGSSISKTVNVPANYSFDDFKDVYLEAWRHSIKGITTYREGTMTAVLQKKEKKKQQLTELEKLYLDANGNVITEGVVTPEVVKGYRKKIKVNGSKYYIFLMFADNKMKKPIEIWVHTNKHVSGEIKDSTVAKMETLAIESGIKREFINKMINDYKGQSHATKVARAIGLLLRHNVPINKIVEAIEEEEYFIGTLPWIIAKELKQYIPNETTTDQLCPNCGSKLVYIEGCKQCKECGWSKCG